MKYKIIISDKANSLIKQHLSFIGKVSKDAAKKQAREFKNLIKKISEDPEAYPFFEGEFIPFGKYHKFLISKRYMIICQVKDKSILIDYVIDTRSDYAFLLR